MTEERALQATPGEAATQESPTRLEAQRRPMVKLARITLSGGATVDLPDSGVVLVVGPNNSGKSRSLRDIKALCTQPQAGGSAVVNSVVFSKLGTSDDLIDELRRRGSISSGPGGAERVVLGRDYGSMEIGPLRVNWTASPGLTIMASYFILHADTETRLSASHPVAALNLYENAPGNPQQMLYSRMDIEARLDSVSRQAFGQGMMLDRFTGGAAWAMRTGLIPEMQEGRPDQQYLHAVGQLPLLRDQGDGMRSMLGLLMDWATGSHEIALIDEPEAFLHPPQAHYLARLLSDETRAEGRLTLISTHSSEIVQGVLDGNADVMVVRLTRNGDLNHAAVIPAGDVRNLWSDSLLRYSNLLQGLFSDGVVVCESDADCRYYSAVLDLIQGESTERQPDILFTHCGGKHRSHVAIDAMKAASVPVVAVCDFDVLREKATLVRLLESLGHEFSDEVEADWKVLHAALESSSKRASVVSIKEAIVSAMDSLDGPYLEPREIERLAGMLKTQSGWNAVKQSGLAGVPNGTVRRAANRLLENLGKAGLHVVPVGELEGFVRDVGSHGPPWVTEVLEEKLHELPESAEAHTFIRKVAASFS